MSEEVYELLIIGGGPAGLTAGIYSCRAGLKTILVEKQALGGQAANTELIENYPGFPQGISGFELAEAMKEQAGQFGLEMKTLIEVDLITEDKGIKRVKIGQGEMLAQSLIVATGVSPKKLGIPGESELTGKGVSYCAVCDGPLFKGKRVAVVGGGDSAIEEALFLAKFCREVLVIHRRDELRAVKILQERVLSHSKIKIIWDSNAIKILGEKQVEQIILKNKNTNQETSLLIDGLFIYVGSVPNTQFLKNKLQLDESGYIIADKSLMTSEEGIFAAGDVRASSLKQVATAVGDGALAAISAQKYLAKLK